jgi:hypothetical protein
MFLRQFSRIDQYLNAQLSNPLFANNFCLSSLWGDTFWSADLVAKASFRPRSLHFTRAGTMLERLVFNPK